MHALFVIQGELFELRSGIQVSEGGSLWPLSELNSSASLHDVLWDEVNLQAARCALAEMEGPSVIFGWDNYRVLNTLTHHIASKSLVLQKIKRPEALVPKYIGEEGSPPPEPAPAPAEEPQESPETEEQEEEDNSVAEAQAEALVEAAEAGVPFCEECEKAKAAQQAEETASASPEEVDAEAQAATLTQAAEAGVPFCEECEKAKKAQGGV